MKKPKEKSERTDTGASAQELYNQTIAQLDSFRTMAHNLSTTKSPGWDTVAELAKIHTWLANNQDDVDYSEHKKSFQTVAQGIKRNFQGIIKLLEGFSESTKDDMISNNTYSLKEWSKTYAEGLELFKYLRPSEAKDGEQTESPKMLGDDIGKLIKQIKKNAYDIMLNRFFPDHKERHTIALELTNLYRWLATNIIGAYDFLPNQETETAISTRYKACLDLLDQLSFDIKNHVAKKNMGELTEWKDVLSDGVKNMEAIVLAAIHRTKLKEKSSPSDTPKSERLSEWTISKHPNTGDKEIDYSDVLHELKILHEENVGKKFTDDQFNEIFAIALKRNEQLYEISIELRDNVLEFLMALDKATDEWKRIKSGVFNQGGQNEDLPEDKSELFGVKKKAR